MTSIASAPLMPPVGEPKRDPAPARAGGPVAAASFKAALATASKGGPAEGRGRPAPHTDEDKPTRDEAARPVLTLLALAKAASQGDEPPEAEPGETAVPDEATAPTSGPAVPAVGKPDVGTGPVIAASHPTTAHAAPGAVPPVAAAVVATAPVPARDPKPSGRTAAGKPAASPEAVPSDTVPAPSSDATAAAGAAIVVGVVAGPELVPAPTQVPTAATSGSTRSAAPAIVPGAAEAAGSSAGQAAAPASLAAVMPPSASAQGSQGPTAPGGVQAKPETLTAAGDIASRSAPVSSPVQAATAGLSPAAGASPAAVLPTAPRPTPAMTRAGDAPPQAATAPQPASVLPIQPVAAVPAAATLARTDAAAPTVPAAMPAAPSPDPSAGDADILVKPETGAAPPALPPPAPAPAAAVAVAPPQTAAAPPDTVRPVHDAGPAPAERAPSEAVSTLTQTAGQTAAAVSAPASKGATAFEPGKATAPVLAASVADASGSQGASQDGAAGQGRGDGRPPSPILRHEDSAVKPIAAPTPVVSPLLAVAGAPEAATSQVLQLFSSLGLTGGTEGGAAADGSAPGTPAAPAPAATRPSSVPDTVTLQLAPEALGRITVTLRLRGQALDVRLVADKRATLESLGRDRHQLEAALGVSAEAIDIAFGPQAGSAGTEGAQQRSAPEANSAPSDEGHGRSRGRPQDAGSSGGDGDGTGTAAPERPTERRDGSLYL